MHEQIVRAHGTGNSARAGCNGLSTFVMKSAVDVSEVLLSLLRSPPLYCAVINRYAEPEASSYLSKLGCQEFLCHPFLCYTNPSSSSSPSSTFPPSPQTRNKLLYYYCMDVASLYPVLALDPQPSDLVLDMCAAPGGKAFTILQMVRSEEGGGLALNDSSNSRVKRLRNVVQRCVGTEVMHSVRITRRKSEEWGRIEANEYDKVLVDAPCSSDRHNIGNWSIENCWPQAGKFRKVQHDLLLSALHAVKEKGTVVYSTCTLSSQENDGVVEDVMRSSSKLGYQVDALPPLSLQSIPGTVKETTFGNLIVPAANLNTGPMYVSKLHLSNKINEKYYAKTNK